MRILIATIAIIIWLPTIALAEDSDADLKMAANRYMETVDLDKLMKDTTTQIAATLPQEIRSDFITQMTAFDTNWMSEVMLQAMTRVFSVPELNALADFYGSPAGRSVMAKMPEYLAVTMPSIQQRIVEDAKKVIKDLN